MTASDLVACAAAFAEHLARELVPACDRAGVRSAVGAALAGAAERPGRSGRRASVLTRAGVPFEASVTGGPGGPAPALRYVADPASAAPFFGPRLAGQRRVVDDLVARLGEPAEAARCEAARFLDAVFPDPAGVPARSRAAAFVGVVHDPVVATRPAWLKVYGNLGGDRPALRRLSETWAPFGEVAALVRDLPLAPRLAALGLGASGARRHKVYLRPRDGVPGALTTVLHHLGADPSGLLPEIGRPGGAAAVGRRSYVACEPRAEGDPVVTLYVPATHLDAGRATELAQACHGSTAALDMVAAAAGASGRAWDLTAVGLGGPAGAPPASLTLYVAPRPAA